MFKYLFGPVSSRRLGLSLGVDLVPKKVCSLNCVYCEAGPSSKLSLERLPYIPYQALANELQEYFLTQPEPDYFTFSGYGEPTLNSDLGKVIHHIKKHKPNSKIAVITNGTLLNDPQVRAELQTADLVLPSLDAVTTDVFQKINAPSPDLKLEDILSGIEAFTKEFNGHIWLEVMILPGYNDGVAHLAKLKQTLKALSVDKIQLNSLDRPGIKDDLRTANIVELEAIQEYLGLPNCEIISSVLRKGSQLPIRKDIENAILETISRRPCTMDDLMAFLDIDSIQLGIHLEKLQQRGKVTTERRSRGLFFKSR